MVATFLVLKKWEKLQGHRAETHRCKLGIEQGVGDKDVGKTDLLCRQEVGKDQNLAQKPDCGPNIKKDGGLNALSPDDTH